MNHSKLCLDFDCSKTYKFIHILSVQQIPLVIRRPLESLQSLIVQAYKFTKISKQEIAFKKDKATLQLI